MLKRTLLTASIGLVAALGWAGPASGGVTPTTQNPACYPIVTAACTTSITIDDDVVIHGQLVTHTGFGLDPNTSATGRVQSTPLNLGAKTVAANGTVSFSWNVPADFELGQHTAFIDGTKNGAPVTLSINFTVIADPNVGNNNQNRGNTGGGNLPRTGDDSSLPLTQAGAALVAVGGGVVYAVKRRRRAAVSS